MRVVKALDAGASSSRNIAPIGADETSEEVERALAGIGARLLVAVVDLMARNNAVEWPQDDAEATYAHRLTKEDGVIDWSWPAARDAQSHPRSPSVAARVQLSAAASGSSCGDRRSVRTLQTSARQPLTPDAASDSPGSLATIVEAEGDRLIVATGDGLLRLVEIQAEGKRPMNARDFLAGHRLTAGDRLHVRAMIAPARLAAYQVLRAVSAGNTDLPTALAAARGGLHDERDRALAAEIASGVQRWRAALDHLIAEFAKRPIDRLDPEIVEILRLSAYQLLHLTRVPAAAVVDDAVDLAKRVGKRSASGFVNAVLRTISRRRASLPLPPRPTDPADRDAALDYLSVTLSHPRWLADRWHERFGLDAAEAWMQFNNTPGAVTLRANRLNTTRDALVERLAAD